MAALRAAKQALRKEIKKRVAALSDEEKLRQSQIISQKVNASVDYSLVFTVLGTAHCVEVYLL